MQNETYKTITRLSESIYKEKGSKFIAFAYPINSKEQALSIIDTVKKQHHSARHHCWAYRLGYDGSEYRVHDAGEPANTAGKPILGQIDAFSLTHILLLVVRYFGGTLLGVGGLIQAYKAAAKNALEAAEIQTKHIPYNVSITCNYEDLPHIIDYILQQNGTIISQSYQENCELMCELTKQHYEQLSKYSSKYSSLILQLL
ncbi:MAG TPA: YigZ family protein [Bacteroidales bacterium]|nr:YigZ family protein [Bacteroidales bacterium]